MRWHKTHVPEAYVVATDVSPAYLRRQAISAGEILETPADVYAAADAETLPFEDGQFDAIYSQVMLYRVPDPVRALQEIKRVLAPGGRYLGIERASPWMPPFSMREDRVMRERAERYGIGERPIRYRQWEAIVESAGLDRDSVAAVPGRRIGPGWLRCLGNAIFDIHVAIRINN